MTMDEHEDCDRQLNEAEDRIVEQAKRIKRLEAHLMNINNCVAIIANDEETRSVKNLPKLLSNLEKYIEQALKGE